MPLREQIERLKEAHSAACRELWESGLEMSDEEIALFFKLRHHQAIVQISEGPH